MKLDLVDVFGAAALAGNPLAVVRGGEGMSDAAMLRLTQWLGFSETAFLLPPTLAGADYRVRIFYPAGELPFAGHPTLGSCHAWLAAGGTPRDPRAIVQECGIGQVTIRPDDGRLAFQAPPMLRTGPLNPAERAEAIALAGVAGESVVEAVHLANGPKWQLLRLRSAAYVLAADPAPRAAAGTDIGLAGPALGEGGIDWELRAFFADQHGKFIEDPVTGSFNAGVATHLFGSGLAQGSYVAAQGRKVGANGRIVCSVDADGSIWIGGRTDTIAVGADL
jgi:PhzF family phenazine biosynthesis protein